MPIETAVKPDIDLAFRPNLARRHFEELLAAGYPRDEAQKTIAEIFERDLAYYYLEQFAKEKLVHFSYQFETDLVSGEQILTSPNYEKLGDVAGLYEHAIEERRSLGKPVDREEAELEGLIRVKERLKDERDKTSFVLVSPPPPQPERYLRPGYGNYSFIFWGDYDPRARRIDMYAWRNDLTLSDQATIVNQVAKEKVISEMETHPNDFLRTPVFSKEPIDKLIDAITGYKPNRQAELNIDKYEVSLKSFGRSLAELVAQGADEQTLTNAQASIEMEFVKWINGEPQRSTGIRTETQELLIEYRQLSKRYNLAISAVGSCGISTLSTFGRDSYSLPGMLTLGTGLFSAEQIKNYFNCPKCSFEIKSGLGITTCPHCGYTKEQAAKDTGVSC